MPVYIVRIYQDGQTQEVVVKADSMRAAKRAAQPKMVVSKLNPEQIFKYAQAGLVFLDPDCARDDRTKDMFPVDFSLVDTDIRNMETRASC